MTPTPENDPPEGPRARHIADIPALNFEASASTTSWPRRRTIAVSAALVVAVVAIATVGSVVSARRHVPTVVVPKGVATPTGVVAKTYAPSDLGVTMSIPSTWQQFSAGSGFQYTVGDTGSTTGFLLATHFPQPAMSGVPRFGQARADYLTHYGAKILSRGPAMVDGHRAVILRYHLARKGRPGGVDDSEYDIELASGSYAVIVLGESLPRPDPAVLDWIASTMRIT